MKRLILISATVMILLLFPSYIKTSQGASDKNNRAGGIEEFNNFKHFDRKENLIHIFSEYIPEVQNLPEDPAIVKEDQLVRWGFEWYDFTKESLAETIESVIPTTIFRIDGATVNDWHYTDIYFFEYYDHDGDGPGDGDEDGIGDAGPNYYWSAFRYSTVLSLGEHTWYYEAINPENSELIVDSGTVIVLPEE